MVEERRYGWCSTSRLGIAGVAERKMLRKQSRSGLRRSPVANRAEPTDDARILPIYEPCGWILSLPQRCTEPQRICATPPVCAGLANGLDIVQQIRPRLEEQQAV